MLEYFAGWKAEWKEYANLYIDSRSHGCASYLPLSEQWSAGSKLYVPSSETSSKLSGHSLEIFRKKDIIEQRQHRKKAEPWGDKENHQ